MRSILSAVDFSEHSRHALRWSGAFAAKFQARLTVISVVDPLLSEAAKIRLGLDLGTTETEPALREFIAATWPSGAPTTQVVLKTPVGEASTAILEAASTESVDLIAVGTQGLGGIQKVLLGSTTERLLRHTRVPVLAVPFDRRASEESNADGMIHVNGVLAATDFSEASLAAAKYAAQLARHLSARLTLANVVEPVIVAAQWRSLIQESAETRAADARVRLESLAQQLSLPRECDVVTAAGGAAEAIGALAENHGTQLIVMGLGSAQGAFAPRPGSIAYRVLSRSSVPVLVVPASTAGRVPE
jgi:nucleotide-binding universal stress UspA family protein